MAQGNGGREAVIEVRDVVVGFGDHLVLDHINLDIYRGEILGFVGGSGAGKKEVSTERDKACPMPGVANKESSTVFKRRARKGLLSTCFTPLR